MKILFICLGNICRSPMAEALFVHHVRKAGLEQEILADSCGTGGWHAGEKADPRMRKTAAGRGIEISHRARQLREEDFAEFDYLLCMDHQNYADVLSVCGEHASKVKLITDLSPAHRGKIVPDPYFGDEKGFEEVFELLDQISRDLVQYIRQTYH